MNKLLVILFLFMLPLLSFGQQKIDIRTQTKNYDGTGIGFIIYNGTAIDTIASPDTGMTPVTNSLNTGWDWIVPGSGSGSGTVTSVAVSNGLGLSVSGSPVTTAGTITLTLDTANASVLSRQRAANTYAPISVVGSVTSVGTGLGLTGGTITTTGTVSLDTASTVVLSRQRAANEYAPISITGTVTSVATGYGLSGGTITTTGTLIADTISSTGLVSKDRLTNSISGFGSGTVTSVATGLGLSGGTITGSGTLLVDTSDASILSRQRAANTYAHISINGTVTSVATGIGLTGGTITTTGTLTADTSYYASTSNSGFLKWSDWQTFNNKGSGTVTSVAAGYGTTFSSITSTGSVVVDTSVIVNKTGVQLLTNKFFTAPVLGTPTSGTLTNCTGLPVGGISATGTPSSTTYLRGDGTWNTPSGGGVTSASTPLVVTGTNMTLTKTGIDTVGTIASGTWNGTNVDYTLLAAQYLGSTIKAQPIGTNYNTFPTSTALNTGRFFFVAVYLPTTATITGVKWLQTQKANAIENNYNGVEIFSYSGGTLTMIDSSARDTAIWDVTANTVGSKAFTSTHILSPGVYYIGFIWSRSSQTTAPAIAGGTTTGQPQADTFDFTNSATLNGYTTSITSPITSQAMSGLTVNQAHLYVALY